MRKAEVYYADNLAGILTETDEGEYTFVYDTAYIILYPGQFISFGFPVEEKLFTDQRLFPFFEGLIPEGWLLDIATKNWKISPSDRMGLLLACCRNCIGAVSIQPLGGYQ